MQMVIFIGAQASGKSSFYRQRFSDSHIRINLDMLRTRCRESILIKACFESSQSFTWLAAVLLPAISLTTHLQTGFNPWL